MPRTDGTTRKASYMQEFESSMSDAYEVWREEVHVIAVCLRDTARITHLEVPVKDGSESERRNGIGSDAVDALKSVARDDGFTYLEAEIAPLEVPDDGAPSEDDGVAQFLRVNGFRDVSPKRSPCSDCGWVISGIMPL